MTWLQRYRIRHYIRNSIVVLPVSGIAAAMLTFIVFLSTTLLVAVQLASGQLTPRTIAFVFRDP